MKSETTVGAQNKGGFTLLELLCAMAILLVILVVMVGVGWGLAFAFSSLVLVPFMGVPAEWVNAVTIICSILLTGVGTAIVWTAAIASLTGLATFLKRRRR